MAANGLIGSLASVSTAASGPNLNNMKGDGYGPNYFALSFEIMFKRKCLKKLTDIVQMKTTRYFSHTAILLHTQITATLSTKSARLLTKTR